jgi:hypothetical protein
VADIDRLAQVDELARLPQPIQELAKILFHINGSGPAGGVDGRNLLTARERGNAAAADLS